MSTVFTFWEGTMPEYIRLCMKTWKFDYVLLTRDNVNQYTDIDLSKLRNFTLPQIADIVRVHVLRDNGGYWLDTDTIMLTDKLPTTNMIGFVKERWHTLGYLYADKSNMDLFDQWAEYQDRIIKHPQFQYDWDIVGNRFSNKYVKEHPEITITPIDNYWAECYMIKGDDNVISRRGKYEEFYFKKHYRLSDLRPTDMLMLHNSWTPRWYKLSDYYQTIEDDCTLSNILKECLGIE